MVKKVLMLLVASLFVVAAGTGLVCVVKANPFWWFEPVSPDEYTEAPVISVLSPANNTVINTDNVYLSFNVDTGYSETALNKVLVLVSYEADWLPDNITRLATKKPYPFVHEVKLTGIPEGTHSITIQANERGAYTGARAFNTKSSETVVFTVNTISGAVEVPEFPAWTILPLTMTATLIAVVLRRRRL